MPDRERHIRHGFAAVRPYLHGHLDLADFVRHAFGALEIERVEAGLKSFHIKSQIGDSVAVLETGDPPHASAAAASVYVYVEDVDATYNTIAAPDIGAAPIGAPEDKPFQERGAGVLDSFGNIWWIATFRARSARPLLCGYNFKAEFPPPSYSSMLSMLNRIIYPVYRQRSFRRGSQVFAWRHASKRRRTPLPRLSRPSIGSYVTAQPREDAT